MGKIENDVRDAKTREVGRTQIRKDPQVLFKDFGFYPEYTEQSLMGFNGLLK